MSDLITNAFNEIDPRNERFIEKNTDIVEEIYALMEQHGVKSQKELAKLLGKKESEVSKLLTGIQNMTLRSITNLEVALGTDIILTASKAKVRFEHTNYMICYKQIQTSSHSEKTSTNEHFQIGKVRSFKLKIA
jgi:predicted XRE-type DNA-binding protein